MKIPKIKDVKTFVPCSPNGQSESISFYRDIGFTLLWGGEGDAVCEFDTGFGFRFLLLEKYNKLLAENLMIQIWVESVDDWHEYITERRLEEKYPGVKVAEPDVLPWGWRILYIWDPAGVLLHVAEPHSESNKSFFNNASWMQNTMIS